MAYMKTKQIQAGNPGQILVTDGTGTAQWNDMLSISADMIEFFELVLVALGHDITYDEFTKMSPEKRKSIIKL